MSFTVLAVIMALLAIAIVAIIARAVWTMLSHGQTASPVMTAKATQPLVEVSIVGTLAIERDSAAETDSAMAPQQQLTRLPAARPPGERRRKIGLADASRAEPGPVERVLNSGLHGDVLVRLEQSFSLLETGRISLETYLADLETLRRSCMLEAERLRAKTDSHRGIPEQIGQMQKDIEDALAAVEWCSQWADEELRAARCLQAKAANDTGLVSS